MSGRIAAAWRAMDLRHSRLFVDIRPSEPTAKGRIVTGLWIFLAALVGAVAGAIMAFVVALIFALGALIALQGQGEVFSQALSDIQTGKMPDSLAGNLTITALLAGVNAVAMFALVALACVMRRHSIAKTFTTARRFRWNQLALGMVLYGGVLGLLLVGEVLLGGLTPKWPVLALTDSVAEIVLFAVATVVLLIIAAGAEELLFRGWLLRETSAIGRNIPVLVLVNAVLFSAIHLDPDLNAFIGRTMMGVVFCYMALRFGGIEFATGAHAANNILLTIFVEPLSFTPPPPKPFDANSLLESLLVLVIGVGVVEAVFRIAALRRLAGEEADKPAMDEVFR